MSIHLVGGGWSEEPDTEVYGGFLAEAAARAAGSGRMIPRVAVLLVVEPGDPAPSEEQEEYRGRFARALRLVASSEPVVHVIDEGSRFDSAVLTDIDGLLVGGGLTPAYHRALEPLYDEIRLLVTDGLPYLGFSAGAMIAAERAVVGGWRIGGLAVCPEDAGEELDEVTVVEGLGLVDLAIDVHTAQWGTLGRLVAAVESGLVDGGVALDERTVLVVGDGLRVAGAGNVWQVVDGPDGVLVGTLTT